jgi:hypothetical protein
VGTRTWHGIAAGLLLLLALCAGAAALQIGQAAAWHAVLDRACNDLVHQPGPPCRVAPVPEPIAQDRTLPHWEATVELAQAREGDDDVWTLTGRVTVPPAAEALADLRAGQDAVVVADALLGRVTIAGERFRPATYTVTQHGRDVPAELTFSARLTTPRYSSAGVSVDLPAVYRAGRALRSLTVEVVVASYEVARVLPSDPVDQTARSVELRAHPRFGAFVEVRDPAAGAGFPFPARRLLEGVWFGLLAVTVFAAGYVLLGRPEFATAPYAGRLRRAAAALLVLYLGYRVLLLLADVAEWLAWHTVPSGLGETMLRAASAGPVVALLALLAVAAPAAVAQVAGRAESARAWSAACSALALALAGSLAQLWRAEPPAATAILATVAGTAVLLAAAAWLGRARWLPTGPACAGVLLTALLAIGYPVSRADGPAAGAVRLAPLVLAVAAMVAGLLALGWVTMRPAIRLPRIAFVVAGVAAVAAAVPVGYPRPSWYYARDATFAIGPLGTAVLAIAVVVALRAELTAPNAAGAAFRVRWLGLLLALLTFHPPLARVAYVPIPLLAGAVLLVWWALPARHDTSLAPVGEADHAMNVAAVLRARGAEQIAIRRRKALRAKVESGDLSLAECEAKVAEADEEAIAARASRPGVRSLEHAVFGSYVLPPWRQAKYGALAGLLAGLPWLLLALRADLRENAGAVFPALSFAWYVVYDLAKWTAYGFLFGALYPFVRGRTGFGKALTLFVTTATPALAAALAAGHPAAAQRTDIGVLMGALFGHFMVLGLLADARALGTHPGRWRQLVDLHNGRAVLAWGTSVVVAFGAALSTAIVSGATAYFVGVLQPQQPPQPPPATQTEQK